jgi:hypothetical protein
VSHISLLGFSQIPTTGLVSSYTFNSGNSNDEVGTNDGLLNGGVTLTDDRFGNPNKAYKLDGVDGYIDFGDAPEFRMGANDFAISLWFQYDDSQLTYIIGKRGSSNNFEQYGVIIGENLFSIPSESNSIVCLLRTNGVNRSISVGDFRGDWHHMVVNHDYDASTSIFIDGVLTSSSSVSFTTGLDVVGSSLVVGLFEQSGPNYFNGKIDDIYIYNKHLTDSDVLDLYNDQNPILSIDEQNLYFNIYPNPTNNTLTVNLKYSSEISVFSLDGKLIESISKANNIHIIDCSRYPEGFYFIKAGNQTLKFIKQ